MRLTDAGFVVAAVTEPIELPSVVAAASAAVREVLGWPEDRELPPEPGASLLDVVVAMLRTDPRVLTEPVRPLTELLAEAGFDVRGSRVGEPGTDWYDTPAWLDAPQQAAYQVWAQTREEEWVGRPVTDAAAVLDALHRGGPFVIALAAADVGNDPRLAALAERGAEQTEGAVRAVGRYLQSRAAEAERLYATAGVPADTSVRHRLQEFLKPPPGETGRNHPCPCGSGKKYKLCHGRTAVHPLPARVSWLWLKLAEFAQRPVNRADLLHWASLLEDEGPNHPEVVRRAMGDDTVEDFAVFEGGLLQDFRALYGDLLPADELALLETWESEPLRLVEIRQTRLRSVGGRDLVTGDELEIHNTAMSRSVEVGDLILGRPLDGGDGRLRLWIGPLGIPRTMRPRLLELLRSDPEPEEVAAWFGAQRRPPTLQTTHGQELVLCEATYAVADAAAAWSALAEVGDAEGDHIVAHADGDHPVVLGSLSRRDDGFSIETNAIERLRDLQARALDLVPEARPVSESTRPIVDLLGEGPPDPAAVAAALGGGPPSGDAGIELDDDVVDQIVRQQEGAWLDGPIPALGGLTPREAAADPQARAELEALLEDYAWADRRRPSPLQMDLARIRRELGLS